MRILAGMILALCALTAAGCQKGGEKAATWTDQDRAAVAHVLGKAKSGEAVTLDLSDPKSARFLKRHYETAGLTADRYPGLHQLMTDQAKVMATKGVTQPTVTRLSDDWVYQDTATVIYSLYQTAAQAFTADAAASMQAAADDPSESLQLVLTSLCFYDSNQNPIGTCTSNKSFGAGQYFPVQGVLNTGATTFTAALAATYYDTTRNIYIPQIVTLSSDSVAPPAGQTIGDPVIKHPAVNLNNALVCTTRAVGGIDPNPGGGTCDYGTFQSTNVLLPLNGTVTYAPSQMPQTDGSGHLVGLGTVSLINESVGGQCSFSPSISGSNFFQQSQVTYDSTAKKLTWAFPSLDFGSAAGFVCGNSGTYVNYRLLISVTDTVTKQLINAQQYSKQGVTIPVFVGINQQALTTPVLHIIAGCLHPDTLIALEGEGGERPIKRFTGEGERVRSAGGVGQVVGTVNGKETQLYEVKAANGLSVKASAYHPFVMEAGDFRAARDLKPGDRVATARGVAAIASVTLIPYQGPVHNLVLPHLKGAQVTPANESFYANGFLVGGHAAQQQVALARRRDPARVRALLPAQFRQDYESHLKDQAPRG